MNIRHYMLIFGFGTLVAFAAWVLVVVNIDPVTTGIPSLIIFLLTLFATSVGLFTTLGTFLRGVRFKDRDVEDIVQTSLRQGILLGTLVIGSLLMLRGELLTWWMMLLMILLLAFIEYVSMSLKTANRRGNTT